MKSIAFVTRVHPKRPAMLKICIESIKMQTSDSYIHILHRDDKTESGYGKLLANQSLAKITSIDSRYVMILDDDDMLIDPAFVETFEKAVEKAAPEIVFFKGIICGYGVYPRPQIWGKTPIRGKIASFCFAVRLDVWRKFIHRFGSRTSGGDYCFIFDCYNKTKEHLWLDRTVARTQKRPGGGRGEHEHP